MSAERLNLLRCLEVLSYDPNSVSQEKGRLLTERIGAHHFHRSRLGGGGGGAAAPRGTVRVINTY
jgi:hypothetical protein